MRVLMKSNTLSFRLLVKRGIAKELIPVVWRFVGNTKVQVTVNGEGLGLLGLQTSSTIVTPFKVVKVP